MVLDQRSLSCSTKYQAEDLFSQNKELQRNNIPQEEILRNLSIRQSSTNYYMKVGREVEREVERGAGGGWGRGGASLGASPGASRGAGASLGALLGAWPGTSPGASSGAPLGASLGAWPGASPRASPGSLARGLPRQGGSGACVCCPLCCLVWPWPHAR